MRTQCSPFPLGNVAVFLSLFLLLSPHSLQAAVFAFFFRFSFVQRREKATVLAGIH